MNDQKTCRHNCAKYDVAEPKNCYKNLQCAKQDGCKIPTSQGTVIFTIYSNRIKKAKRSWYPTIKKLIFFFQLGLKPGRLFDCQFYHADAWVCMSQDQSKRKYDWIEYEDGRVLGKKDQCESKLRYLLSPYHPA